MSQGRKKAHGSTGTRTQDQISSCLNRIVPESSRNHAGTEETVPLLLAVRARTHTEPPNITGEKKAHGPTGTRTQDSRASYEHSSQLSYRATRSTCHTPPPPIPTHWQTSQGKKSTWPNRDSNQGPLAHRASSLAN